jgi:NADPH:quinone reductase-like Zn-dependent oxidoreductase
LPRRAPAAPCITRNPLPAHQVWATAYQILHLVSKVQAGETVLVHAAASGVGTAMIQLAKLAGVKTIAVASSDKKLAFCTSIGADHVINYKETPEFQERVMELTGGKGVEVVADPVGASNAARNQAALAFDGRWVLYGFLGGADIANFNLRPMLMKRLSLLVTSLKSRSDDYKRELLAALSATVFTAAGLAEGVVPVLDRVMPLSQAAEAHTYMEENGSIGKTLLKVDL